MSLSFEELRKHNVKRCEAVFHPLHSWTPTDWACAMAGETGEACNYIKKLHRLGAEPDEAKKKKLLVSIAKELSDVVCYVDLLAARLEINLEKAVISKFNEVSDRKGSDIKLKESNGCR